MGNFALASNPLLPMKIQILLASLVLAAASTAASFAAHSDHPERDPLLLLPSNAFVTSGMSRDAVLDQLGQPSSKLSPNVWVYADFRAKGRPAGDRADALLVVFSGDRVSLLRVTEQALVNAALAKLQGKSARDAVVARK